MKSNAHNTSPPPSVNWDRLNLWTTTLYTLIQSLQLARAVKFGDLATLQGNVLEAGGWTSSACSYSTTLNSHPFGRSRTTFRRNPNDHFEDITQQIVSMLLQDIVVIFDGLMDEILAAHGETAGDYPQSKVEKLATHLKPEFQWAKSGCIELIAVRNVFTHANGRWNQKSIDVIKAVVSPWPAVGDRLVIGFPMLFRYRKAIRTFINEVLRQPAIPKKTGK